MKSRNFCSDMDAYEKTTKQSLLLVLDWEMSMIELALVCKHVFNLIMEKLVFQSLSNFSM